MPRAARTKVETNSASRPGQKPLLRLDKQTLKLIHFCGSIRMTYREAAMRLGVGLETFNEFMQKDEARAAWEKGEGVSFVSLRSSQFKLARTHPQMAIHLGKIYLGQKEEVHVSGHVTLEQMILESVKRREKVQASESEPDAPAE